MKKKQTNKHDKNETDRQTNKRTNKMKMNPTFEQTYIQTNRQEDIEFEGKGMVDGWIITDKKQRH